MPLAKTKAASAAKPASRKEAALQAATEAKVTASKKTLAPAAIEDAKSAKKAKVVEAQVEPAKVAKAAKAVASEEASSIKKSASVQAAKPGKSALSKETGKSEEGKKRASAIVEDNFVVDTTQKPAIRTMKIACEALLQHVIEYEKAKKQKALSLPGVSKEDQAVFLQVTLRNMPEQALKTFKGRPIPLPHPFRDIEGTTVCMLVKDKVEAKKWLGDDYEKHGINKIISLQQLRTDYKAFQDKRDLAGMYDAFVADDRIVCMLPKALGKAFYVGAKKPLPIRLAQREKMSGDVTAKVQTALKSAYFYLPGVSTSIRIGTTSQNADELAENIEATLAGALKFIPGHWSGIQSIFVKTEKSAALPLYEGSVQRGTDAE